MNITRHRFILIAAAVVSGLTAAPAPSPQQNAINEYIAAGNALITVLTGIKDVNTAKAAQTNLLGAVVRFNAAKATLKKLTFDQSNPEHQTAINNATPNLGGIGAGISAQLARLRASPKVQQTLQQTLAML